MRDEDGGRRAITAAPGRARRTWARHPRLGMALKAALAASLAWALVRVVPGPAADYPYYAPLGAVVATSTTLTGSVRESAQTVTAISLGAGVALSVDALAGPNLVTIALVVAIGVLVAGWPRLGSARSWVPTSGLFVLIIGNTNPTGYVLGYAGLTLLGALVGLAVTAVFPPLPLAPAQAQLQLLRDTLADQLDDLAAALRQESPPTAEGWEERTRTIDPVLAGMRAAVEQSLEAQRGNRKARRYAEDARQQVQQARALERLTLLVEELTDALSATERAEFERVALGPALRPAAARALAALADALRSVRYRTAEPEASRAADEALRRLTDEVRRARTATQDDLFVAGSVVDAVRRGLVALSPPDDVVARSLEAPDPPEGAR
ncbi:Uncharacterized membrane protein YgaE, UPF0421/DUF939 family [Blastococcus aggregatus]|uniref:Uncharacterized membrane protein YgaE, UPF0421/DUF939 family n=1 Tax=Blastococcus aggregatus TaxID=38502 RepID=A0A285V815_9ACTN|nr:hypothetical protein [Blastococcus aggregatus]SOC49708.1 Uncharacterized membrane protein YgaE, UPF0421/DUF939 family [Blastococcus aggregatus]